MYDLIAINIYGPQLCDHQWLVVKDIKIKSLLERGSHFTGGSSWQSNYNTMCFLPLSTSPQGSPGTLKRMPNSRNVEDTCCCPSLPPPLSTSSFLLSSSWIYKVLMWFYQVWFHHASKLWPEFCPTKNIRTWLRILEYTCSEHKKGILLSSF